MINKARNKNKGILLHNKTSPSMAIMFLHM